MIHSTQKTLGSKQNLMIHSTQNAQELLSHDNTISPIRVQPDTLSVLGGKKMCASAILEPDGTQGLIYTQTDTLLLP